MDELWKPIEDFEGYYEVSDLARVRSLDRVIFKAGRPGVPYLYHGRILAQSKHVAGYSMVGLWKNNHMKMMNLHRLVAIAFVEGRADGLLVCHKDGDPSNNVPENLYWGTMSDNMQDAKRHGRNWEANKTHCPYGHEYTPENTVLHYSGNKRRCRTCSRQTKLDFYYRVTKPKNDAILAERRARGEQVGRWPRKPPQ